MTFSRPPSGFNRKISTMPRQQTESAYYLRIYKLTIEKKRLQQELKSLEQRRDRIQEHLESIEQHIQMLDGAAHEYRDPIFASHTGSSEPNSVIYPPMHLDHRGDAEGFNSVTLEY
jgi:hypothetical protein